jgi:hypothetical protein
LGRVIACKNTEERGNNEFRTDEERRRTAEQMNIECRRGMNSRTDDQTNRGMSKVETPKAL